MDIVGPLPRSRSGNKYVLVVCDEVSRGCAIEVNRCGTCGRGVDSVVRQSWGPERDSDGPRVKCYVQTAGGAVSALTCEAN